MIVGHELSHGFDDEGMHYDGGGALRSWWSPASAAAFRARADCFDAQYSNLTIVTCHGREHINGRLTLGENIADNAGMQLAYAAWQRRAGGLDARTLMDAMQPRLESEAQLFFLAFASDWCQKVRPEFAHLALLTDVHSPAEVRVNGALQNMQQFADAYHCPPDKPMTPKHKCSLYV